MGGRFAYVIQEFQKLIALADQPLRPVVAPT
jgi:hypothetical protein